MDLYILFVTVEPETVGAPSISIPIFISTEVGCTAIRLREADADACVLFTFWGVTSIVVGAGRGVITFYRAERERPALGAEISLWTEALFPIVIRSTWITERALLFEG